MGLADAILGRCPEMVKILLKNGADVHAETRWLGETMLIHEFCAQRLQKIETENERAYCPLNSEFSKIKRGCYSLDNLEQMREINKLVMDKKKDNRFIQSDVLN